MLWYIDHRQLPNGEMGGGLSDDTDLANSWPGLALMGIEPEKITDSDRRILDACYAHGMFTRGLPTIQTDELHSYEEGINALGQMLTLEPGSPRQIERAMETARGIEMVSGVNRAGHRHLRSSYYSGTRLAEEGVWGWAKAYSYLVLQPVLQLGEYNGNPTARKLVQELADGLLAHRQLGANGKYTIPAAIEFATDADGKASRHYSPWALFWAAWRWTGDQKYLDPIFDEGLAGLSNVNANLLDLLDLREKWRGKILESAEQEAKDVSRPNSVAGSALHFAWQLTGDKSYLEKLYGLLIERAADREYINTEGSLWIDRVYLYTTELQRARLGGVALNRNAIFPGHVVSWRFHAPASGTSVALLIPHSSDTAFDLIAYNLEDHPVTADMSGWNVAPGEWKFEQGVDENHDDKPDGTVTERTLKWGRNETATVTFPARAITLLKAENMALKKPNIERADLSIDRTDIQIVSRKVAVVVHNIGAVSSPEVQVVVLAQSGKTLGHGLLPSVPAASGYDPSTKKIEIIIPDAASLKGASIVIDPADTFPEIDKRNNVIALDRN